ADKGEKPDAPKLFFTLAGADIIPACMTADMKVHRNRGPVDDIWDDGPSVGQTPEGKPMTVAGALMLGVGLLSAEWLTRKRRRPRGLRPQRFTPFRPSSRTRLRFAWSVCGTGTKLSGRSNSSARPIRTARRSGWHLRPSVRVTFTRGSP